MEIVSCTFRDNNVAGGSSVGNGKKGGSIYFEADYSTDPDYQYSLTIQARCVPPVQRAQKKSVFLAAHIFYPRSLRTPAPTTAITS